PGRPRPERRPRPASVARGSGCAGLSSSCSSDLGVRAPAPGAGPAPPPYELLSATIVRPKRYAESLPRTTWHSTWGCAPGCRNRCRPSRNASCNTKPSRNYPCATTRSNHAVPHRHTGTDRLMAGPQVGVEVRQPIGVVDLAVDDLVDKSGAVFGDVERNRRIFAMYPLQYLDQPGRVDFPIHVGHRQAPGDETDV